jgi:predicted hydrocarbon binding protein
MNATAPTYYYPNRMGRIVLLAMEEIIGRNGVNAVLRRAALPKMIGSYPPEDQELQIPFRIISDLQKALEDAYGPRGGRGIALRTGRACFQHGLKAFGASFGLTDLTFRLLPLSTKLKTGSEAFANIFNKHTDQRVRVEDHGKTLIWIIERCPICWERRADEPVCHLAVGLLQEALYWASGGKFFDVEETHCLARGDSDCRILIDKTPLS